MVRNQYKVIVLSQEIGDNFGGIKKFKDRIRILVFYFLSLFINYYFQFKNGKIEIWSKKLKNFKKIVREKLSMN